MLRKSCDASSLICNKTRCSLDNLTQPLQFLSVMEKQLLMDALRVVWQWSEERVLSYNSWLHILMMCESAQDGAICKVGT
jgi:hypothetical protein